MNNQLSFSGLGNKIELFHLLPASCLLWFDADNNPSQPNACFFANVAVGRCLRHVLRASDADWCLGHIHD